MQSLILCNKCVSKSLCLGRPLSTLARPTFASYFFHNDRWNRPRKHTFSSALVVDDPLRSVNLANYRETEALTPRRLLGVYAQLAKTRLTALVVLSAMSGVALSPFPTTIPILLSTAIGTTLCSASANTLNQIQEVPFDAQMSRTRLRPLVRRAISPMHAAGFAAITGLTGPALLWVMVNPTTAALGALNIGLYAGLYTWLKRKSIVNTWVGAVVGGIPPLMGWTACGGSLLPSLDQPVAFFLPQFISAAPLDISLIGSPLAPLALFMLLFSWQFPHFNGLSHLGRESYAQAGYRMLSVISPIQNSKVSLRHALLLVPICSILFPLSGLTTWTFAVTSLVPNAICVRAAWRFWQIQGEKEARKVFQHSLWYLPVIIGLMMLHKQGIDWAKWLGMEKEEDDSI